MSKTKAKKIEKEKVFLKINNKKYEFKFTVNALMDLDEFFENETKYQECFAAVVSRHMVDGAHGDFSKAVFSMKQTVEILFHAFSWKYTDATKEAIKKWFGDEKIGLIPAAVEILKAAQASTLLSISLPEEESDQGNGVEADRRFGSRSPNAGAQTA